MGVPLDETFEWFHPEVCFAQVSLHFAQILQTLLHFITTFLSQQVANDTDYPIRVMAFPHIAGLNASTIHVGIMGPKNGIFARNDGFYTENDGFHTKNDGFHTKNDGFHTKHDGRRRWAAMTPWIKVKARAVGSPLAMITSKLSPPCVSDFSLNGHFPRSVLQIQKECRNCP